MNWVVEKPFQKMESNANQRSLRTARKLAVGEPQRSNKDKMKHSYIFMLFILNLCIGCSDHRHRILEAEEIRINDEQGRARAILTTKDGSTVFVLNDGTGHLRASIRASSNAPFFALHDNQGNIVLALTVNENGPSMSLLDTNTQPRIALQYGNGNPGFTIFDDHQRTRLDASLIGNTAIVSLFDSNGAFKIGLFVNDKSTLTWQDGDNRRTVDLPTILQRNMRTNSCTVP